MPHFSNARTVVALSAVHLSHPFCYEYTPVTCREFLHGVFINILSKVIDAQVLDVLTNYISRVASKKGAMAHAYGAARLKTTLT
jgi:hypothetical protein